MRAGLREIARREADAIVPCAGRETDAGQDGQLFLRVGTERGGVLLGECRCRAGGRVEDARVDRRILEVGPDRQPALHPA